MLGDGTDPPASSVASIQPAAASAAFARASSSVSPAEKQPRNYASHIVEKQGAVEECAYIGNAVILPGSPNGSPFVSAGFDRMSTLGFPIPPLMIALGWYHAAVQGTQGVQIEAVETLIAPIEPGSRQLLAPLPVWTKDGIKTNPAAEKFISDVKAWMPGWTDLVRKGFDGKLDANAIPIAPTRDPSAPQAP